MCIFSLKNIANHELVSKYLFYDTEIDVFPVFTPSAKHPLDLSVRL